MMTNPSTKARIVVILGTIVTLTFINLVLELTWPPSLVQAGATLPSRKPPSPSSPSDKDDDNKHDDKSPIGAYIVLQVQPLQTGLWTVVQWQDSAGNWQNVEGWQGTLDEGGKEVWWVEAKDFGKGPFRWAVYQGKGDKLLTESTPFHLPETAGETVMVKVSLRP